MKAATTAFALLSALALLAVAGCDAPCPKGPPVSARGQTGGGSESGSGSVPLTVTIMDAGVGPLPGATVVVWWSGDRTSDLGDKTTVERDGTTVEVGPDGAVVEPGMKAGTPEATHVLRMLTSDSGQVVAHVPSGLLMGIVAAKEGYTEEWVGHLGVGDSPLGFTLPLYRTTLSIWMNGTLSPGALSTGEFTGGNYAWSGQNIPFPPAAQRGYAARMTLLDATVGWSNDPLSLTNPGGMGDLAVAAGPDAQRDPTLFADSGTNTGLGPQQEELRRGSEELRTHSVQGAEQVFLGPATASGYSAPMGLPYTLHAQMEFDRALSDLDGCLYRSGQSDSGSGAGASIPGLAFPLLVLALLGTAAVIVVRRKA